MQAAVRTHVAHDNGADSAAGVNAPTTTTTTTNSGGPTTTPPASSSSFSTTTTTVRAAVRVRPLVDTEMTAAAGQQSPAEVIRVVTAAGRLTRPLESAYALEVLQPAPASRTPYGLASGNRTASAPQKAKSYAFDVCAGPSISQAELFMQLDMPALCEAALAGQVVTVFCFGQTGSGKTFTLSGRTLREDEVEGPDGPLVSEDGLQYQAAAYIARRVKEMRHAARRKSRQHSSKSRRAEASAVSDRAEASPDAVVAKCSCVELYQEALYDLLQPDSTETVRCRWSAPAQSFYVEGSLLVECRSAEDFTVVLREGQRNRQRGSHALNRDSSRSHVVFTIFLEVRDGAGASDSAQEQRQQPEAQTSGCRFGRLVFVDLAGSERLKKSQSSSGAETGSINKSLFTLGRVLELLSAPETTPDTAEGTTTTAKAPPFIPYRSSILTQLLMQSLDGHGRTLMVACVSPSALHLDESLRTLHYAQRARHIRTSPVVHVDAATQARMALEETVRALQKENALLRRALQLPRAGALTEEEVERQVTHLLLLGGSGGSPIRQQQQQRLPPTSLAGAPAAAATSATRAARDRATSSPVPLPTPAQRGRAARAGGKGAAVPPAARVNKRTVAPSEAVKGTSAPSTAPSPASEASPSLPSSARDEGEPPPPAVLGGSDGVVSILAMLDALPDTRRVL